MPQAPVPVLERQFNWICRRRFLRRQIAHGKLHRPINWDARDSLGFIDPGVGAQFLGRGIARRFQFLLARSRSFRFVVIAVRRSCYQHQHENSKEKKKQNDTEPCPKRNRRAFWCLRCSGNGHVSSSNAMTRSTADRAPEKWTFSQLTADKGRPDYNQSRSGKGNPRCLGEHPCRGARAARSDTYRAPASA